jgi:hypothetical protein
MLSDFKTFSHSSSIKKTKKKGSNKKIKSKQLNDFFLDSSEKKKTQNNFD